MSYDTNPTSSNDPEVLRREIERTRGNLSQNVNALGEAVDPGNVARRQAEKVQDRVVGAGRGLKERIMGSDDDGYRYDADRGYYVSDDRDGLGQRLSGAGDRVGDAASETGDRLRDAAGTARSNLEQAPAMARRQTRGNPLAAGLIALGAGWLVGSLLPVSERERELAVRAKETAQEKGQPLVEGAKSIAQEAADNLKEPLQDAAASLKDSAQESVEKVKGEGQDAAETVKAQAKDSKETVQEQQRSDR
ncbi:DUF3618 domain-containing protein [Arsenicicoccus sp. oral taxon 190]|uniref:DUF3618 domain-containing protein n=1 Tax=Arsenicicoccus sp. oral taxon 190 TaxID=1658671 RepID=UPI00067A4072|nr:DUF3618 domain-containing protein [Arsenicicoccus sp. oral taxon 190]AKT50561.1 hypothetical protein ADJ73_03220 [Arsenicicoccus sp. oral taxon 190]